MTNSIRDIAEQSKVIFIVGSNTTEQHPVIGIKIRRAKRIRGAKLIVADPRKIDIARYADLHLRHKPGTDIALLNGIMHIILREGWEDKDFIANWLSDLLDGMGGQLDRDAQVKLIESCGRGCFRRHAFKRQIAADGCGSVEKLVDAYNRNFEAWVEDDGVHVRYGEVSKRCYCPVANTRAPQPDDLHCECTKATHAAIFTGALGRDVNVDIVETLRRGGKTCHFVARV
jgi:anaerobic selenocysteine-containing dehydrogenase